MEFSHKFAKEIVDILRLSDKFGLQICCIRACLKIWVCQNFTNQNSVHQ